MHIDFTAFNPLALLALVPAVLVCLTRRHREAWRRDGAVALVLGLCLGAALSGVIRAGGYRGTCHLVLMDYSGSALPFESEVRVRGEAALAAIRTGATPRDLAGVVLFGRDAVTALPPGAGGGRPLAITRLPRPDGTDLAGAVAGALQSVPPGFRPALTVIGDGSYDGTDIILPEGAGFDMQTVGDLEADAAVVALDLPGRIPDGQGFEAVATVAAGAAVPAAVRLYDGATGRLLETQTVRLEPGLNPCRFRRPWPGEGPLTLIAEVLAPGDLWPENNAVRRDLQAGGLSAPVLVIADTPPVFAGVTVVHRTPVAFREQGADPAGFAAVVLADVPYAALGDAAAGRLIRFVTVEGGGLLVTGRERAFGPGGYADTPLDRILPLASRPDTVGPSKRRIMVAVDRSGSMAEPLTGFPGRKIDAAKGAALAFIDAHAVEPLVRTGLLFFSAAVDMVRRPDDPVTAGLAARLGELVPRGGTRIIPALEAALEALAAGARPDEDRYIFIITDSISREELTAADIADLAGRLTAAKVQLLTLAISGGEANDLRSISQAAGGTYHDLVPGEDIRVRFMRETDQALTDLVVREPCAVVNGPGAGLSGAGVPAGTVCRAFVRTGLAAGGLAVLFKEDGAVPLAAVRFAGVGRVAAVAGVDLDPAFDLDGRLLAWIARRDEPAIEVDLLPAADGLTVTVRPAGAVAAGAAVLLRTMDAEGAAAEMRLVRTAEGFFAGTLRPAPGPAGITWSVSVADGPSIAGRYQAPYGPEYDPLARRPVMARQASLPQGPAELPVRAPFLAGFLGLYAGYEVFRALRRLRWRPV
ncbi:MAG: VWA domain-containing protein [Planctomycetota bacterium]